MATKKMYVGQLNIRLTKEILEKFKEKADKEGRQISEVIRQLVMEYLKK